MGTCNASIRVMPALASRAASPDVVLTYLKHATAEAHHQVEHAVGLFGLGDRTGYELYLGRLLGFYEPFEPLLENALGERSGLGLEDRRKTPLLHQDLTWLAVDTCALPRCQLLPRFSTRGSALGGLYVVEGATLGGRELLRRHGTSLNVSPRSGAAFLGCYGDQVGERWQAIRAVIAAAAAHETDTTELVEGAASTFEAFARWLRTP